MTQNDVFVKNSYYVNSNVIAILFYRKILKTKYRYAILRLPHNLKIE